MIEKDCLHMSLEKDRLHMSLEKACLNISLVKNCLHMSLEKDCLRMSLEKDCLLLSLKKDCLLLSLEKDYSDEILNINNVYFDNMVSQIYPSELQLNKANTSDTEAAFLDLYLSISNNIVSTKSYDKRDDFNFEIVNFSCLDGDVPRSTSYGVYIYQSIRFARASSYVADFNTGKNC